MIGAGENIVNFNPCNNNYTNSNCKDASASLEPKIPKSHQEQATDAVNSLLEYKLQT